MVRTALAPSLMTLLALAGCAAPRPRGTVIGPPIVLPEADLAEIERARVRADWPTLEEWARRSAPPAGPAPAPAPVVVIEPRFPAEPYPRVLAVVPGVHDPALGLAPPLQGGVPVGAWTPGPPSATGLYLPPHVVGRAPF